MNKRGFEKEYLFLFYLVLAALVGLTILSFINLVKDDRRFEMQRLAIDSALLVDSISASPIDLQIKSSFATEGYLIYFNNEPCVISSIFSNEQLDPYSLYCYTNLKFNNNKLESLFINFNKKPGVIEITK